MRWAARVFAFLLLAQSASAETVSLRVGGGTFSDVVSREKGFYAKYGLAVDTKAMPSGPAREGLTRGTLDIADHGADNMVALVEDTGGDLVIVMGTNSIPVVLAAQPGIASIAELRGKTLLVDDLRTQNALVLKKMLRGAGIKDGEVKFQEAGGALARIEKMRGNKAFAATMTSMTSWLSIEKEGFVKLASSEDVVGPLMFYCVFVERTWAKVHEDVLVRYLASHIEAQRWMMDPKNRADMIALMAKTFKVTMDDAVRIYENHLRTGWPKDGAFDREGFDNVLKLRAEVEGSWGGKPPSAERYVDLSYYEKALALAGR